MSEIGINFSEFEKKSYSVDPDLRLAPILWQILVEKCRKEEQKGSEFDSEI